MLFSTQNIHLEKSLRYLISFSFHTILKGNHLPIHIQKLMQQVHLHSHNHLRYKLVWLFPMALPESLQLSESDCREQCTQEIWYLFLLLEVKLHFLQARIHRRCTGPTIMTGTCRSEQADGYFRG